MWKHWALQKLGGLWRAKEATSNLAPQSSADTSVMCSPENVLSGLNLWPSLPALILPNLRQDKEDSAHCSHPGLDTGIALEYPECQRRWQPAGSAYWCLPHNSPQNDSKVIVQLSHEEISSEQLTWFLSILQQVGSQAGFEPLDVT